MQHNYSYQSALAVWDRIGWKVDDIIGGDKRLEFTKPFMPESLAQAQRLSFLTPDEQLTLNQIAGMSILPCSVLSRSPYSPTRLTMRGRKSPETITASGLLEFAGEEAIYPSFQVLPAGVRERVRKQMRLLGSAEDVSRFVLSHSPLGVGIAILHIEWIIFRDYIEGVKDNQDLPRVQ